MHNKRKIVKLLNEEIVEEQEAISMSGPSAARRRHYQELARLRRIRADVKR